MDFPLESSGVDTLCYCLSIVTCRYEIFGNLWLVFPLPLSGFYFKLFLQDWSPQHPKRWVLKRGLQRFYLSENPKTTPYPSHVYYSCGSSVLTVNTVDCREGSGILKLRIPGRQLPSVLLSQEESSCRVSRSECVTDTKVFWLVCNGSPVRWPLLRPL